MGLISIGVLRLKVANVRLVQPSGDVVSGCQNLSNFRPLFEMGNWPKKSTSSYVKWALYHMYHNGMHCNPLVNEVEIEHEKLKSWTRRRGVVSSGGYYAASLASACDPREEKGELGGEGADHVVPGPHAAGAHNAVLCQQLASCFSGSPAHFTWITVDENISMVSSTQIF